MGRILFDRRRMLIWGAAGLLVFLPLVTLYAAADSYRSSCDRGRVLFNQGRYKEALAAYAQAESFMPSSKEAILNQAMILKNMRDYTRAGAVYRKLLRIEPDKIIYLNMGEVLFLQGQTEEAIAALQQAIVLGQKGPMVYFWLGRCFESVRDWENAIQSYAKAVEQESSCAAAHHALGQLYSRKQQWTQAQKEYETTRELDPSITGIYSELAQVYLNQKLYERSLEAYRKVQAVDPDDRQAQVTIDRIYALAGESLKQAQSQRETQRLAENMAQEVVPAKVPGAPLVRVHIGDVRRLRFKCSEEWFVREQGTDAILFRGEKNRLYAVDRDRQEISITSDGQRCLRLSRPVSIAHLSPAATFLIFDVEAGIGQYWASKTDRIYRGAINISNGDGETLRIINVVNLEEYLYGVLPSEMPPEWPAEALKAQAVAARSEADVKLGRHGKEGYDFCSGVHCQAYSGARVETKATNAAVDSTCGEVAVYNGKPIDAVYSNSCGGHTQDNIYGDRSLIPYLRARVDAPSGTGFVFPLSPLELDDWLWTQNIPVFCNNDAFSRRSNFRWMRVYSKEKLQELINKKMDIGALISVDIAERNLSGHIQNICITGSKGVFTVEKELTIRQLFGDLRSGMFNIDVAVDKKGNAREFLFYGGGWGHGVGMCQVGAATMAQGGYTYDRIIQFYYTDTQIKKMY
ncbi:MAG: SpoIID/LytB domain-containing protein [Candidatus Omnitrophica bacterium]|nr:SpoIID/LytB domain-containing protein [Candidatus Omnitrophota bacterium]